MTRLERVSDRRQRLFAVLLLLALYLAAQGVLVGFGALSPGSGDFFGTDSYAYLVRARQLHDTGAWFADTNARSNAPLGVSEHSTRPFDVLLLAGAAALAPLLGFEKGLIWWAALVSPLLYIVTGLALAWASAPLLTPWRRLLAVALFLIGNAAFTYAMPGRVDHHSLVMLTVVICLGLTARAMVRWSDLRLAAFAGGAAGFGVWVSVELLLLLAIALGALSIDWARSGGERSRRNLWHAAGMLGAVAIALLLERSPSNLWVEEYDRISVVHVLVSALAFGFWGLVLRSERRSGGGWGPLRRLMFGAAGSAVAAALLLWVFPKFFLGPMVDLDPRVEPIFFENNAELMSPFTYLEMGVWRPTVAIGLGILCVPFLGYLLIPERTAPAWGAWLLVSMAMAVYLPGGLLMMRFAPFVEILVAVTLAELLGRLAVSMGRLPTRRYLLPGASGACLLILGLGYVSNLRTVIDQLRIFPACTREMGEMSRFLSEAPPLRDGPSVILADPHFGSEIQFRTDHSVVGTMSHRNVEGVLDTMRIFYGKRTELARNLVEKRGIDWILICRNGRFQHAAGSNVFHARLLRGKPPEWVREVRLPPQLARVFRLYEVQR